MASKKQNRTIIEFDSRQFLTTPIGKAGWANLNKPSKTYNNFEAQLIYDPEEIAEFEVQIEELIDFVEEELKSKSMKKFKLYSRSSPITDQVDEDGDQTGKRVLKARSPGEFKVKDDDTGETIIKKARPPIAYDAQGKRIKKAPSVWSGSDLALSVEAKPYVHDSSKSYGVTFRIGAYQVINLIQGGMDSMTAEQFGFGMHEGGYSSSGQSNDADDEAENFDIDDDDIDMDQGNF